MAECAKPLAPVIVTDLAASINATVSFAIGCTLNSILIWLILKRSSTELRTYSRVLLQIALLSMAYSTISVLFAPVMLATAQSSVIYGVGWLARENDGSAETHVWNANLTHVWSYLLYLTQFSVIVPFIFRYFALCRGYALSGATYGALLTVTAATACFFLPYYFMNGVGGG